MSGQEYYYVFKSWIPNRDINLEFCEVTVGRVTITASILLSSAHKIINDFTEIVWLKSFNENVCETVLRRCSSAAFVLVSRLRCCPSNNPVSGYLPELTGRSRAICRVDQVTISTPFLYAVLSINLIRCPPLWGLFLKPSSYISNQTDTTLIAVVSRIRLNSQNLEIDRWRHTRAKTAVSGRVSLYLVKSANVAGLKFITILKIRSKTAQCIIAGPVAKMFNVTQVSFWVNRILKLKKIQTAWLKIWIFLYICSPHNMKYYFQVKTAID